MSTSQARANWNGTIKEGKGKMAFGSFEGNYSFSSRFEDGEGASPEELVGAAHSGCFSMYLSLLLTQQDLNPESIDTSAEVVLDKDDQGPCIKTITLDCKVKCDGLDESKLDELAENARKNCPVSRLYAGGTAEIKVKTELV